MLRLRKCPAKSQRKMVRKDQLQFYMYKWDVCLKIPVRENLFYVNLENWLKTRRQILQRRLAPNKKIGKEGVHREELSKSVNLMSVVLARQNSGKDHMRRPCTKKDAPAEYHGIWRKIFTSSRMRTKLRFILLKKQRWCRLLLRKIQRSENSQSIREHQCTWWAKKRAQMNWILCEDPETLLWYFQLIEKCIQLRRHKLSFTISIYSWLCNYSKKRLQFYRLENSAKITDTPVSASTVKNHGWPKKGRHFFVKRTTSYLLLFQGCHPVLVPARLVHRYRRTHRLHLQQVQQQSEVTNLTQETGADHP